MVPVFFILLPSVFSRLWKRTFFFWNYLFAPLSSFLFYYSKFLPFFFSTVSLVSVYFFFFLLMNFLEYLIEKKNKWRGELFHHFCHGFELCRVLLLISHFFEKCDFNLNWLEINKWQEWRMFKISKKLFKIVKFEKFLVDILWPGPIFLVK